ncbi:reverse transcriptase domain-containing protein [Tanacetum coccineum]
MKRFALRRRCFKDLTEVSKIIRKAHKMLLDFKEQWMDGISYIQDVLEVVQISAFASNSKFPELTRITELPRGEFPEKGQGALHRGDRPPRDMYERGRQRTDNRNDFGGRRDHYQPYVYPRFLNQILKGNSGDGAPATTPTLPSNDEDAQERKLRHRGNAKGRQQRNNNGKGKVINMIRAYENSKKHKSRVSKEEDWMNVLITFPPILVDVVSNEPLIVEAKSLEQMLSSSADDWRRNKPYKQRKQWKGPGEPEKLNGGGSSRQSQVSRAENFYRGAILQIIPIAIDRSFKEQHGHICMETFKHKGSPQTCNQTHNANMFVQLMAQKHKVLVDSAFQTQLGRNLEAYVDDMVIKIKTEQEMIMDIADSFDNLQKSNMKLNPKRCSFSVKEGNLLGYMVTSEGIRVNPKKTKAVANMQSPRTLKEMQSLSGKLAALNRFLARSAERSLPFFETLKNITKNNKDEYRWTEDAKHAFQEMKRLIMELPSLTTPKLKETLYVYLAASQDVVSGVLLAERKEKKTPIRHVSRTFHEIKRNYAPLEKWPYEYYICPDGYAVTFKLTPSK